MKYGPVEYVVALFKTESGAADVVKMIQAQELGLHELAVLQKDAGGSLHIHEPGDAGALIGGLASRLHDSGFDNRDLQALAQALVPGTSALMLVVDDAHFARVKGLLEAEGAHVVADALRPEVAEGLDADYTAFIDQLKQRGIDGLTAKDWALVDDQVDEARRRASSQLGADFIDPLV